MRYAYLMVACALLLVLPGVAADVPEPRAVLSWDADAMVENLDRVPDDPVFLYVTLLDVPDVKTASFETVWCPWSAGGGCYEMISCVPAGPCGWLEGTGGAQELSKDIEATHTLNFDGTPGEGSCIRLAFTSNRRRTDRMGSFCLRNFRITDFSGQEIFLRTPNVATILGGVDLRPPQYICEVEPAKVSAGVESALRLVGGHFSKPLEVSLAKDGSDRVIELRTQVVSDSEAQCTIAPTLADTGRWTIAAKNGDGFEASLHWDFEIAPARSAPLASLDGPRAREFALRCYPNPSRSWVDVAFTMPQAGPIRVTIHDATGRVVRVLDEPMGRCGTNRIRWNCKTSGGTDAAAGVYIISVESGGARKTEKLIIAR